MKNKPDPALKRTSYLSNEIKNDKKNIFEQKKPKIKTKNQKNNLNFFLE
jgi:hypothetical protein